MALVEIPLSLIEVSSVPGGGLRLSIAEVSGVVVGALVAGPEVGTSDAKVFQ